MTSPGLYHRKEGGNNPFIGNSPFLPHLTFSSFLGTKSLGTIGGWGGEEGKGEGLMPSWGSCPEYLCLAPF